MQMKSCQKGYLKNIIWFTQNKRYWNCLRTKYCSSCSMPRYEYEETPHSYDKACDSIQSTPRWIFALLLVLVIFFPWGEASGEGREEIQIRFFMVEVKKLTQDLSVSILTLQLHQKTAHDLEKVFEEVKDLKNWVERNLLKFIKDECRILQLGKSNPMLLAQVMGWPTGKQLCGEGSGVLVDKFTLSQ